VKKSYFLCFLLALFSLGCSETPFEALNRDPPLLRALKINTELFLTRKNCEVRHLPDNKDFYIRCNENCLLDPVENYSLPYKCVEIEIHLPKLHENKPYLLLCGNTGDPSFPVITVILKNNGRYIEVKRPTGYPKTMPQPNILDKIPLGEPFRCAVFANPGYCSDWFLGCPKTNEEMHTSFTYKPHTVSLSSGETLTVSKKEPGGNILEISMEHFPPNKELVLRSLSEGEQVETMLVTEYDGSCCIPNFTPGVIGKTKGTDQLTLLWDDKTLETSVDWDASTLDMKRRDI
jgi:hypothetical protein